MTERDEPYTLDVDEAADAYADLMVVRLGAPRAESIAAFRRMIEAVRAEERAEGVREGHDAERQALASGAFIGGPTYEALRDSATGRRIRQEERERIAAEINAIRNDPTLIELADKYGGWYRGQRTGLERVEARIREQGND